MVWFIKYMGSRENRNKHGKAVSSGYLFPKIIREAQSGQILRNPAEKSQEIFKFSPGFSGNLQDSQEIPGKTQEIPDFLENPAKPRKPGNPGFPGSPL